MRISYEKYVVLVEDLQVSLTHSLTHCGLSAFQPLLWNSVPAVSTYCAH